MGELMAQKGAVTPISRLTVQCSLLTLWRQHPLLGSRRRNDEQGLGSAGQSPSREGLVSETSLPGLPVWLILTREWGLGSGNRDSSTSAVSRAGR